MEELKFQYPKTEEKIITSLYPKECSDGKTMCHGKTFYQLMGMYFNIYIFFLIPTKISVYFILFSVEYEREAGQTLASCEYEARNILKIMNHLILIDGKYYTWHTCKAHCYTHKLYLSDTAWAKRKQLTAKSVQEW